MRRWLDTIEGSIFDKDGAPVAELSPYGPLLATGGTDGVVRMWQWSAG